MKLGIEEMAIRLEHYSPRVEIGSEQPQRLGSARFLAGQQILAADILYVGRVDNLRLPIKIEGANLLLLGGHDLPEVFHNQGANTIHLPGELDLELIFNEVQEILASINEVATSAATLLNSIIQGRGLKYIIQIGAEILDKPLILIDTGFNILAYSDNKPLDEPMWGMLLELGYCPHEFVATIKSTGIIENTVKSPRPIIINSCRYTNLERIIGKVAINDKVVGYVIVLTNQMQFTEKDIELVSLICDVVAAEMGKNKLYSDTRGLMYENLLVDLLENKINRADLVLERARSAGYQAGDRMYVMSIDIQQNQANHYFLDYIRESVEKRFLDCKSVLYKNNIVVLLDLKSQSVSEETLIERMQSFLQKNNLRAGVSRCFSSLVQFREHFEQSQKTLKLATILDKEGCLFFFEKLKVYHLLSLAAEREDLMSFCHPAVFRLINWDEAHSTSYAETLWALLSNDLNINLAAEKMFIHRNTMSYRVGKIIEMTGLSLKDGDTVFQLLLTKRILTYINHVFSSSQPHGIPTINRKKAILDK